METNTKMQMLVISCVVNIIVSIAAINNVMESLTRIHKAFIVKLDIKILTSQMVTHGNIFLTGLNKIIALHELHKKHNV